MVSVPRRWIEPWLRNRLFRKYVIPFVAVVSWALLTNGLLEIYFTYQESRVALAQIQREKANAAALQIEHFVREIERQMGWTTQPQVVAPAAALEQRRIDYLRLQRQVPAITEVTYLDGTGREQLRVSRLAMEVMAGGADASAEPRFRETRGGRVWYGPVYFRKESEPYMTLAVPHGDKATAPVTAAEVNLKFIWDVVSKIRVGRTGLAYVVDSQGYLIAHPDIGLVLRKTDLSTQPHVQAARAAATTPDVRGDDAMLATNLAGHSTLVANTVIAPLGWIVFVEQPVLEAFAPLRGSILRTGLFMLVGVLVSVVASLVLARKIVRPVQALQAGAARIGGGDLAHRIDVRTGDELQDLGEQFNRMTGQLQESYATLEHKVEDRTRELSESLDQQTATAEILRVISSSPTDVQPVLETVADNAKRICGATDALIMRVEGDVMRRVAHVGAVPANRIEARPITRGSIGGRAILDCRPIHVADVADDTNAREYPDSGGRSLGARTITAVPLVREGVAIGVIVIRRTEVQPFTDKQLALLQTFADQAVIAIENVRLFKELETRNVALTESLDQQTATAEILKVISSSPTDVQPVLDAVAENATRVCGATDAIIFRVDDDLLRRVAHFGPVPTLLPPTRPLATNRSAASRAIRECRAIHIADILDPAAAREYPDSAVASAETGLRTTLTVPLIREEVAIGAIMIRRTEVRPFSDKQIALLKTFADQAVIAIENVRLFNELEARTADLTRSVGELQALGDVGRAISSTLDFETVLDTIVSRANQLAGTDGGAIYEYEEATGRFHLRATHNFSDEFVALLRETPLEPGEGAVGRAGISREPVQIADIADASSGYASRVRDALVTGGYRSLLAVPLVSEDEVVGALVVNRREAGAFPARVVDVLRTFGTQSALAIQNARLFREIEDKSRQLEAASRHKDEFLASMSHELRTPLNAVIGFSEVLLEKMFGDINAKQEEYLGDILASGRHLLSLINDILDLAKIEAGRMELDVEEYDVAQAVDNAVVLVRERATRKGLTLETRLDLGLGALRGDQRKIKQVLLNLLSNAVKFTPEGGRVEVRAQRLDGHVEVSVTDTGIGIATEDLEAVFEEFRQVGTDYAKKHEGTGLGLTLSRKFVELHGGRIWVKSQPGQGSTFTFSLPVG